MREELEKFIGELKSKNGKYLGLNKNILKNSIILPIFKFLDWDSANWEEVYPDYVKGLPTTGEKSIESQTVDYCLRAAEQAKVFLKVEKLGEELELNKEQFLAYALQEKVEMAILTNGFAWNFYLPLEAGKEATSLLFPINILQQPKDEIADNFISFLSKGAVTFGTSIKTVKTLAKNVVNNSLTETWNVLIEETNEDLIKLFKTANEKIGDYKASEEQIKNFIFTNKEFMSLSKIAPAPNKKTIGWLENNWKGEKPTLLIIDGRRIPVKNWTEVLMETCKFLLNTSGSDFRQKLLLMKKPDQTPYFSKDSEEFEKFQKIKDSDIYAGTGLEEKELFELSKKVAELRWGEGNKSWDIELRQKPSEIPKEEYEDKKPTAFTLDNTKIPVNSWRGLLMETCNFLYKNCPKDFEEKVLSVKGDKAYFSKNPEDLKNPKQIENTKIYVGMNLTPYYTIKISKELAALFGYATDLHIETRQE